MIPPDPAAEDLQGGHNPQLSGRDNIQFEGNEWSPDEEFHPQNLRFEPLANPQSNNLSFNENELSPDEDPDYLSALKNLHFEGEATPHDQRGSNIVFMDDDFSQDDDQPFDTVFDSVLRSLDNIAFDADDFSSDLEPDPVDALEFEFDNDVSNPPSDRQQSPEDHDTLTRKKTHRRAFLDSLLGQRHKAATKEDVALLVQMVHDQYKKEQQLQLTEARTRMGALDSHDIDEDPAYDADAPESQVHRRGLRKRRKPIDIQLAQLVRQYAFQMMKRTPNEGKKPSKISSVSKQEIKAFLRDPTNSNKGPRKDRFILDFNEGAGASSPWNTKATSIFAQEFVVLHPEHSVKAVAQAFKTHLFHLKNQYKKYIQHIDDISRMGDQAALLKANENAVHIARMFRRKSLRDRRADSCARYFTGPEMEHFKAIWKNMPVEAVSRDETDHYEGVNRYIITRLPWRAAWVHNFMLVFDRLHLLGRFTEAGRATPGAFPHIRILGNGERIDRECITPPVGLPRNFYCNIWLSKQTDAFVESLKMADPINFVFPRNILRMARSCRYVTSHKTPPIPLDDDSNASEEEEEDSTQDQEGSSMETGV